MSNILNKITFEDKEDLINLNTDSNKVLTADNINEIKNTVNTLIDDYYNILTYDQIFKHIRFNIPKGLIKDNFYSLKIQLSSNRNFSEPKEIICYPTLTGGQNNYTLEEDNNSGFSIFKNDNWISYKNLILMNEDEDTEVKIDIQDFIKDENNIPFFGRYKLINLTSSEESVWHGFALGFSTYKNSDFFPSTLKEIKIVRTN